MIKFIKKVVKKGFNAFGIDIKRIPKWQKDYLWLTQMNINTILDIGANIGGFAQEMHRVLPGATIYSFEPLDICFKTLQTKMQKIRKFNAFKFALGDFNGETYMYRNKLLPSSSILEMGELHKELFPPTQKMMKEKIIVKRLDDVVREFNLTLEDNILIKMDVQGYEDKVILGGKDTFSKTTIIITEVSFVELYKGQVLFDSIYSLLRKLGFTYTGHLIQLNSPNDGKPIQADAIFLKSN